MVFIMNLLDFENWMHNNDASMERASDNTIAKQIGQEIVSFEEKTSWREPLNCGDLSLLPLAKQKYNGLWERGLGTLDLKIQPDLVEFQIWKIWRKVK